MVTLRMIFPTRSITRLEPGYETSFLLRAGEPTRSVGNLFRITTRVCKGFCRGACPVRTRRDLPRESEVLRTSSLSNSRKAKRFSGSDVRGCNHAALCECRPP
jgi:hypothetical protein